MSNRAQRRKQGIKRLPAAKSAENGPMLSVFGHRGGVAIHAGLGDSFMVQLGLTVSDAKVFRAELDDVIRSMELGLQVAHGPSEISEAVTRQSGLVIPSSES